MYIWKYMLYIVVLILLFCFRNSTQIKKKIWYAKVTLTCLLGNAPACQNSLNAYHITHPWNLFEAPESSGWAKLLTIVSITIILVSNIGVILDSMSQFQISAAEDTDMTNKSNSGHIEHPHPILNYLEIVCVI